MKTCRTYDENIFSAVNIRNCERYVFTIQQKLDRAVATKNVKRIRHIIDLLTKRSKAVKILAVYRITKRNQGKNTAGIDGISIPKGDKAKADKMAFELLDAINIKSKPNAIKRVFIPKPNGKKRPLGIPTIKDRIIQEILRTALEPIVEYYSHDHSFGFRPKRSSHDAIALIFNKLALQNRPRYIVEGDIKGCFDNISHKHISETLIKWNVSKQVVNMIEKMLKAKVFHNGNVYDNETGTPQGGVISPLLANVALTSLDNFIENNCSWVSGGDKVNPLVRYADDFVIICKSKTIAVENKNKIKEHLKTIGLTLSEEKSKITHINKGFNFLGFNVRKYKKYKNKDCVNQSDYKLLIKPQKEKIKKILGECIRVMKDNKTAKQSKIIQLLNPKITGWANYYRYVVSSAIFNKIDRIIWHRTLNWGKRIHPQKRIDWIIRKYYSRISNTRILNFVDNETNTLLSTMFNTLSKKRFVKIKNGRRVYSASDAEYWRKREYFNTHNQMFITRIRRLFEKQEGICPYCKTQIKEVDVVNSELHVHHMLPRSSGGTNSHSNLRLMHDECHVELHKRFSRKRMTDIIKTMRLDYINTKESI